jgi:AcrR family transcriptional regulator
VQYGETVTETIRPVGRRERKKQQTREAIAREGLRLFVERGFKETTIAQIAEAADVAESTFFLHFPTKDDLVFAGHDEEAAKLVRRLHDRDGTAFERLRDYLWQLSEAGAWDGALWTLRHDVIRRDPELAAQERARWADVVRPALAEAFAHDFGEPEPAVRAHVLAAMAVGALTELGRIETEVEEARAGGAAWKREALGRLLERLELLLEHP